MYLIHPQNVSYGLTRDESGLTGGLIKARSGEVHTQPVRVTDDGGASPPHKACTPLSGVSYLTDLRQFGFRIKRGLEKGSAMSTILLQRDRHVMAMFCMYPAAYRSLVCRCNAGNYPSHGLVGFRVSGCAQYLSRSRPLSIEECAIHRSR